LLFGATPFYQRQKTADIEKVDAVRGSKLYRIRRER